MSSDIERDLKIVVEVVDHLNDFLTRALDQVVPEESEDRKIVLGASALFMMYKGLEACIDEHMDPLDIARLNELITSFVVAESIKVDNVSTVKRVVN